jgi:hypothetical protein
MHFEISSNQFARYRDDRQQSFMIVSRLPQVTFPNVSSLALSLLKPWRPTLFVSRILSRMKPSANCRAYFTSKSPSRSAIMLGGKFKFTSQRHISPVLLESFRIQYSDSIKIDFARRSPLGLVEHELMSELHFVCLGKSWLDSQPRIHWVINHLGMRGTSMGSDLTASSLATRTTWCLQKTRSMGMQGRSRWAR